MYGLSFSQLATLHPFHLAIDHNMCIVQAGTAFRKIQSTLTGRPFDSYFELYRPRFEPTFENISSARNAAFLITCDKGRLQLKGQMILDQQRDLIFFIGAPVIRGPSTLSRYNLSLGDFPMADSSIDILVFQQQKLINEKLEKIVIERTKELRTEKDRSEKLIRAILPDHIIRNLENGQDVIAEQIDHAAVMFLDIVGFTEMTTRHSARDIVTLLNELFKDFDGLVASTEVEKIKTIGDAYMCVGGLGRSSPEQSTRRVALLALEMFRIIRNLEWVEPLNARVGMHVGPALAGVIGATKFSYDLWGDTVNTAARMEAYGEPGRIHCTSSIYKLLGSSFEFQRRGQIDIKGKGSMETYFLLGEKAD